MSLDAIDLDMSILGSRKPSALNSWITFTSLAADSAAAFSSLVLGKASALSEGSNFGAVALPFREAAVGLMVEGALGTSGIVGSGGRTGPLSP